MAKISIIIPCYNAENNLSGCLRSLENQTIGMENLEVIFVNDASTDHTLDILISFERKYPEHVLVVNCEKNGRQGMARNIGLSYATAEYIGFADDDDEFEPEMYECMYEKAKEHDCDLVMCQFDEWEYHVSGNDIVQKKPDGRIYEIATMEQRREIITMGLPWVIWTKLYRKELITDHAIRFLEGCIYDDICFTELIYQYSKKIYMLDAVFYHHILREKSASVDINRMEDMMGFLDVHLFLLKELQQRNKYKDYQDVYIGMLTRNTIGLVKSYFTRYGEIKAEIMMEIKEKIRPYKQDMINSAFAERILAAGDDSIYKRILGLLVS